MFKILGSDGKGYGPIPSETLRQWIREGRANAETMVLVEGSANWQALGQVGEFASALIPPPPPLSPPGGALPNRASNKIAAGICGILLGSLGIHKFILGYTGAGLIMLLVSILTCGFGAIVMGVIGLIEGIIYFTKSDEEFVRTYVDGRREWF